MDLIIYVSIDRSIDRRQLLYLHIYRSCSAQSSSYTISDSNSDYVCTNVSAFLF